MSKDTDLPSRLEALAKGRAALSVNHPDKAIRSQAEYDMNLLREAKTEIERLRAENGRLRDPRPLAAMHGHVHGVVHAGVALDDQDGHRHALETIRAILHAAGK